MGPRRIALLAADAAAGGKARDVVILDVEGITLVADYFVICSATTRTQVKAIADHIVKKLAEAGYAPSHCEGYDNAEWILADYGPVVVHVFREDQREFYSLERLWGDARVVEI